MSKKLMDYLPPHYRDILDFIAITDAEDAENALIRTGIQKLKEDAVINTASPQRISEWEKVLNLTPQGNLTQRRMMVLATIRGSGKLNEAKIINIVSTFTGGYNCVTTFGDSTITVYILVPVWGEIFLFDDIGRAIRPLIPAHLNLSIQRFYSTWRDVRNHNESWQTVMNSFTNWEHLKNKVYDT